MFIFCPTFPSVKSCHFSLLSDTDSRRIPSCPISSSIFSSGINVRISMRRFQVHSCVDLCWYKSSIDNALRSSGNFFSFISVANLQDEIRVTSFWHLSLFSLIELSQLHHVFDSKTGTTMMSFNNGFSSWDVQHHCWTFLGTTVHSGGQQTTNCSWLYSLKTRIVN